jgi:hypothetical protein
MHDSAQANGLRNDCLNEREYPIRSWENVGWISPQT